MKPEIEVVKAGLMSYSAASEWQTSLHAKRVAGEIPDTLLILEHPHTYTLGRRFNADHLLWDEEELNRRGIELHQTDRGGSITYHGPGQLIAYPIIGLSEFKRVDVVSYLRALEKAIVKTLDSFGLSKATCVRGKTGVWIGSRKIASIGVRFSRGVTKHGLALNVNCDTSYFEGMVPCGIEGCEVTTMEKELGREISIEQVAPVLIESLADVLGRKASKSDGVLPSGPGPKPSWLKTRFSVGPNYADLSRLVTSLNLNTVCKEAKCPNIYECWNEREATFLILGDKCTRRCGFCDIATAKPASLDWGEPLRVADAVEKMGLRFAVVTGVERDDCDQKDVAEIWAATIRAVRARVPGCGVEVLTGDLKGNHDALKVVLDARPDVFAHNLETVKRLHPRIRPGFRYERSLQLLATAKRLAPVIPTKSNLIVGLGETFSETVDTLKDLREAGVDLMTIGQYLSPTRDHAQVERWVTPSEFEELKSIGESLGFAWVESGPLVRSSYHAGRQFRAAARNLLPA